MRAKLRTFSTSAPAFPLPRRARFGDPKIPMRPPVHWTGLLGLVLVLVLCGCTVEPLLLEGSTLPAPTNAPARLLVSGIDGNIYTMNGDGGDRLQLTDDASSNRIYTQPTWSPTGEQVAFSRMDTGAGGATSALVVTQRDGLVTSEVEVPFAPFYIYWSPQGDRLVYLSNWMANSMALRLVDLRGEAATDSTLAQGQPFYFSWSPDGEKLLTHVANEETAIRSLDGTVQPLSTASTGFPAPQWSSDGESLLFAISDGGLQNLVVTTVDGQVTQEVTQFSGNITFSQSPTSRAIAYVVTETSSGFPTFGELYVIDVDTLRTQELTDQAVIAFFWSPDGSKLAYITVDAVGQSYWLRWNVWNSSADGDSTTEFRRFLPSRTFLQRYLIFFDQYARSMNVWNPDGSAFAYAGTNAAGRSGIWVQSLEEEMPQRISNGDSASWAPR